MGLYTPGAPFVCKYNISCPLFPNIPCSSHLSGEWNAKDDEGPTG